MGKVALIGLNSLFGQASSLLLKLCPSIYNLRLYDDTDTSTADDVRFINTPCKVEAYQGKTKLNEAIKGSDIVLIGDDILSTPQTCFDVMAPKMQDYAKAISESSPNALIIVAASPINKLVPVLSELLQENGYYDCNRVMGTTASYNIRANCVLASYVNTDPRTVFLPVVGGDSEDTIVPLFSQAKPHFNISEAVMKRLIEDIKQGSPLIYETKGSTEALNKAHATVKFLNSVIAGLRGEPNIMNIAFTKTTQVHGSEYFALPVLLGRFGIQARYGIPRILPFENDLIRESVFGLQKDTEFAKLFCKTRDAAAETCSRNVAITYKKSKEFEQFVNGLKTNKKGNNVPEDKIVDKINPPIPVESGELSGDKPFDTKAFCLRHKVNNQEKNNIIPAYMRTGNDFMPLSLAYTLGGGNGTAQFVPRSSSAETLVCEPAVCPDIPKRREMSYTNIVSLVEKLVKQTTEKMMKEKENDERAKTSLNNVENLKASPENNKSLKTSSEKDKNSKLNPDKGENVNKCLRKIDTINLNSETVGNFKTSSKKFMNFPQKVDKLENKFSKSYGIINNKSASIRNSMNFIVERSPIPIGKINKNEKTDDKTKPHKGKYIEKKKESIFRPTSGAYKERFDYKSGLVKLHNPKKNPQTETKEKTIGMKNVNIMEPNQQNISINDKKQTGKTVANHDSYNKAERVFRFKANSQSFSYGSQRVPTINNHASGENKNWRNTVMKKNIMNPTEYTKTEDYEKKYINLIMNSKKLPETTATNHNSYNKVTRVTDFKLNRPSSQYPNSVIPSVNTPTTGGNNKLRKTSKNQNILNEIEDTETQGKEKSFKKGQNISIPIHITEADLCKQKLRNTSNDSKKNASDENKKNITSNTSENVARENLQPIQNYKTEQDDKSNSVESSENEKIGNGNLDIDKFIRNKCKTFFEKQGYIFDKKNNKNDPLIKIKEVKNIKNVLLGNLNSSMNKENMFYDKINKTTNELLIGRNSERKTIENIDNFKNLFNDKSCKDTKDFVKYKLRSKYLANKSANNRLIKEEKDSVGKSTTTENKTNDESKSDYKIKSVCFNAFSNEVTEINNIVDRCDLELFSSLQNQYTGENNNNGKKSTAAYTKQIKSRPEAHRSKKHTDISFQENQINLYDSRDLNMLMKTLDSDVFKYVEKVNRNDITNNEFKQVRTANNNSDVPEEPKLITDVAASYNDQITEECNDSIKSEIKEKVSQDVENLQTIHQTDNLEPNEMTFEDVIKEIKTALQSSKEQDKSINTNKPNEEEKLISNCSKDNIEIKNLPKNQEDKMSEGADLFPQSEDAILEESSISNKCITLESISEEKELVNNQVDFNHSKASKIKTVLQNISKNFDKSKKNLKKSQDKLPTQAKVIGSTNNPEYINKASSTIPERFLPTENRDISYKKNNVHERDSVSYLKSLRNSLKSKENSKPQRKIAKQEGFKKSIKNLKDYVIPLKSVKQKNTRNKFSIKFSNPMSPLSKYSTSFVNSKYNTLISKRKNASEMLGFFSGQFGQRVNEINKAEHSFSLRDKNGINNYYLLKGLLPKIKNNKQNLDKHNCNISLLKTNICNEDPFMSVMDKEKIKINRANETLVKPILENKDLYISNDGGNGPLFITHNSMYSPNCRIHRFKQYPNSRDDQKRSISPTNKGNISRINEAMHSNLCRMCNKVRNNEKNSSHQLNQRTHNFKLYSTSALPMKKKSPSCLCIEKRKTLKQVIMTKNESTGAKLPKGFIKKQRISKILEKDLKKIKNQKSSKYRNAELLAKEGKLFIERQAHNLKERYTTLKNSNFHPHVMSRPTKIDENFFNSRFDSTYIERYLKVPPKHIPHQELCYLKDDQQYRKPPKSKRVADIYKINWSDSQNNSKQTETNSVSVENDILARGTCTDHVRNKLVSNKSEKHELSNDSTSDEQSTVVNSMESSSLAKAFLQYTKDYVKCEYPTNQKLPSIRQLHKSAFHF